MTNDIMLGLISILGFGITAQWIAWRTKIPSIIVLLSTGFFVGPITGLLNPDQLLGNLLYPIVALLVSIIVFEGGMSLKLHDLKQIGKDLRNLIIIGTFLSFVIIALSSIYILGLPKDLGILFGAMMVITGPTVIIPLLRQVSLNKRLGSLIRWEGILIAPVGTILIVLVFQYLFSVTSSYSTTLMALTLFKTLFFGGIIGYQAALLILLMIKHNWTPDFLQEVITLTLVILSYTLCNALQSNSGLVGVVIMGIMLANQRQVMVRHIAVFKENLRILAISSLFIILAAKLDIQTVISNMDYHLGLFLLVLIVIARPVPVFIALWRSKLTIKERLFTALMAPRGIVTASIASLFALQLESRGIPGADKLVTLTFSVIIVTVTFYGFSAIHLQRLLKLSNPSGSGILIVGANKVGIAIAKALEGLNISTMLVDTNKNNVVTARMDNHTAYHRSIFSDQMLEEVRMSGIKRMISVTPSDEVNMLSVIQYSEILSRDNVYRLIPDAIYDDTETMMKKYEKGRFLFEKGVSYSLLNTKINNNAKIQIIDITKKQSIKLILKTFEKSAIAIGILTKELQLEFCTVDSRLSPSVGDKVLVLV